MTNNGLEEFRITRVSRTDPPKPPCIYQFGRWVRVSWNTLWTRPTDLTVYARGLGRRRVYTQGLGIYWITTWGKGRQYVDIHQLLRLLRAGEAERINPVNRRAA